MTRALSPAPGPDSGRRQFLRTTTAGVAGASLLTMLQARQAPAQIKGTSLRILQWSHFVPAYDTWFDGYVKKWGEQNGVKVRVDRIPHLDLPSRFAAELAAGAGHDLIYFVGTILTALYHKSLVDLTDMTDKIGAKYGGWIPAATPISVVEGRWYALPDFYIVAPMLWRRDLFEQERLAPPDTWEQARVAARTLKAKGHPTGIAFSHCNDANLFLRAILFSHGAREADAAGNILLDSKEMREGLKFLKALFDEGMTPEVFSWDDASDNRFLASGVACWIHDAISAYRSTEDTNPKVFQHTAVSLEPQGLPGKRVSIANPNAYAIWKFAKNAAAAKEYLLALNDQYTAGMTASRGYNMPFLKDHYKKPMPVLGADPKLSVLQDQLAITSFFGYPGPITPAAQEVQSTFVIPDVFTRVARGASIEDSMKWAVGEYQRIYAKHKA